MNKSFWIHFVINFVFLLIILLLPLILGISFASKISVLYYDFGGELLLATKLLLNYIHFFQKWWHILIPGYVGISALIAGFVSYSLNKVDNRKLIILNIVLNLAVLGLTVSFVVLSIIFPIFSLSNQLGVNNESDSGPTEQDQVINNNVDAGHSNEESDAYQDDNYSVDEFEEDIFETIDKSKVVFIFEIHSFL